jgi:hypothetical protein
MELDSLKQVPTLNFSPGQITRSSKNMAYTFKAFTAISR